MKMSKYTTTVRSICESNAGQGFGKGYDNVNDIILSAVPKIFSFPFEIFDEEYRVPLCAKILKHYYTREISEETVGLWKLRLDTRLNEIMPYYNELYKSTLYDFDPLITTKIERKYTLGHTGETTTDGDKTTTKNTTDNVETNGNINKTITDNTTVTDNYEKHLTDNETGNISGNSTDIITKEEVTDDTNNTTQKTTENKVQTETENEKITSETAYAHDNTHYDLYSETPQGGLDGLETGKYLTNARKTTDDTDDTTNVDSNRDKNGNINLDDTVDFTGNLTGKKEFNANNKDNKTYGENTTKEKTEDETNTNTKTVAGNVQDKTNNSNTENRTISGNETEETKNKIDVKNTDEYIENLIGKQGDKSYASLILEFRKSLINIDKMIIEELSDLFFMLW